MASSFLRFPDHTQRHTTVGRTPLDEWSARRRNLYLTTHNTHNIQISMRPVGFEPTISADERPQTYALDRPATGTGIYILIIVWYYLGFIVVQLHLSSERYSIRATKWHFLFLNPTYSLKMYTAAHQFPATCFGGQPTLSGSTYTIIFKIQ